MSSIFPDNAAPATGPAPRAEHAPGTTGVGPADSGLTRRMRWVLLAAALIIAGAGLAVFLAHRAQRARLVQLMMSVYPDKVTDYPAVVRFAVAQAKPLFVRNCARCHGTNMRGNPIIGAANLTNNVWLWGNGSVFQIDRIMLYGIRSGQRKSLHITVMPAFGVMGRLSAIQVSDLVQYLLKENHRPYQVGPANAGQVLFYSDPYGCTDCHSTGGRGESDYGAPDLMNNVWNNGGDPKSIYDSIYYGRDRVMPAFKGTLSLEQIRALAIYVHEVSHGHARPPSG